MNIGTLPPGTITQEELELLFGGMPAPASPVCSPAGAAAALPDEEAFITADHRTCDCPLTYVHRKRHAALGTGIQIRLCCLARFVEERFGMPAGTFFKTFDFAPTWTWDCDHVSTVHRRSPDGSTVAVDVRLGPPPAWLLKRLREKGVEVRNLPADAGG